MGERYQEIFNGETRVLEVGEELTDQYQVEKDRLQLGFEVLGGIQRPSFDQSKLKNGFAYEQVVLELRQVLGILHTKRDGGRR